MNDEKTAEEASTEQAALEHPSYEQLFTQLTDLESERDKLIRLLADKENSFKRVHAELDKERKFAVSKLIQDLLSVVDSLELGLKSGGSHEGMELTLKLLQDTLAKYGVQIINPEGELFNPAFHEAMSMVEHAELPPGTVLQVLQKGYLLHERLVRPAMVIVSKINNGEVK